MDDKISGLRKRLIIASAKRGRLAEIAAGSKVSSRTIYSVIHSQRETSKVTIDKLLAYFRREDRKAERAAK